MRDQKVMCYQKVRRDQKSDGRGDEKQGIYFVWPKDFPNLPHFSQKFVLASSLHFKLLPFIFLTPDPLFEGADFLTPPMPE